MKTLLHAGLLLNACYRALAGIVRKQSQILAAHRDLEGQCPQLTPATPKVKIPLNKLPREHQRAG